ncbi:MAG: zinc ribbon domain-containing protein [Erysipelothrix sp.]|nr:zinc ribbon domain-containing protein [Erysipelothrix sp.]
MNDDMSIRIPKQEIVQAGNALGIKPNRIAMYFGLHEGKGNVQPDEAWKSILPVILQPLNFSGVKALFEDDSLLFTNILSNDNDAVFCGVEEGDLLVLPMESDAIMELLASYLGEVEPTPRVRQELSLDALIAMLAIVDCVRRVKLKNVLDPSETSFDLDLVSISEGFKIAVASKDLRWLAPFMDDLRWEAKEADFNNALNELSKLGIVQYKNKKIEIDERGRVLFDEFLNRKTVLGIRSVFYHEGALNYLSLALVRTQNYLWYLDGTEKSCVMTMNYEELKGMIATMIAPGEVPEEINVTPVNKVEDRTEISGPRFCRKCGEKLSEGAKFCKSCGAKMG